MWGSGVHNAQGAGFRSVQCTECIAHRVQVLGVRHAQGAGFRTCAMHRGQYAHGARVQECPNLIMQRVLGSGVHYTQDSRVRECITHRVLGSRECYAQGARFRIALHKEHYTHMVQGLGVHYTQNGALHTDSRVQLCAMHRVQDSVVLYTHYLHYAKDAVFRIALCTECITQRIALHKEGITQRMQDSGLHYAKSALHRHRGCRTQDCNILQVQECITHRVHECIFHRMEDSGVHYIQGSIMCYTQGSGSSSVLCKRFRVQPSSSVAHLCIPHPHVTFTPLISSDLFNLSPALTSTHTLLHSPHLWTSTPPSNATLCFHCCLCLFGGEIIQLVKCVLIKIFITLKKFSCTYYCIYRKGSEEKYSQMDTNSR